MKKIIFLTVAAATLLLTASCKKTETDTTSDKVIVNINVAGLAPETKAVKTGWAEGDKINIWFNDVPAGHYSYWKELPHLVLTYTAGAWTGSDVDVDLLSASGTFKAIYEASNAMFTSVIDSQYAYYPDGTKFKFSAKSGQSWTYRPSLTCFANSIAYNYDSGTRTLSGTISGWKFATRLQVVITGLDTADPDRYALTFAGPNQVSYADALYCTGSEISTSASSQCNGIATSGWNSGVSNADGIAFCFWRAYDSSSKGYTMYLVDKIAKKTYSYSKTTAINTPEDRVTSIKLAFSLFSDISSANPMD